jgi:hypothetical protein
MKIYTAAKLTQASKLLKTVGTWEGHEITSRWIKRILDGDEDPYAGPVSPEVARAVWIEDEEDVRAADVVLVYWEPGDNLRGALVEAGMGIALGKDVIVVGHSPAHWTWKYHPRVWRAYDLDEARTFLNLLNEWRGK